MGNDTRWGECVRCGEPLTEGHRCHGGVVNHRAIIEEQSRKFRIKHRLDQIHCAIAHERVYQDNKWGTIEEHGHSLAEWVLIAEAELNEAKTAVIKGGKGRNSLRSEIIQTIAVLQAALEQHGVEDDDGGRAL